MKFKIDSKPNFTIISPQTAINHENLSELFEETLLPYLKNDPKHVIVDFHRVLKLHEHTLYRLMTIQQEFYDQNASLIYCNFQSDIEQALDELTILENLNIAEDLQEAIEIIETEINEKEI